MYITNKTYFILKYFLLKHKKREQKKKHKISGIKWDFVFVKVMHWSGSVEVAAILHELSRCLSRDFG